jgi:DNA-binding Xre family transcriptional regulator
MGSRTDDSRVGSLLRYNVDRLLVLKGWQAVDLYQEAGLTAQQYSRLFKTSPGPRMSTIMDLANVLGVEPAELLRQRPRR